MKILSLKVRGLTGIKKGMDLDEVSIDFSKLSGLIGFSGVNGKGKTSILESLPPYAMVATRAGALQSHYFLSDSRREQEFMFNGDHIRTRIDIRGGTKYAPDGYIWINDQPKTKGKISEYKGLITEIFGSSDMFYNIVMKPQNWTKITSMDPAVIKNLFAEFLNLNRYIYFENLAKGSIRIINGKSTDIINRLAILESKLAGIDENLQEKIDILQKTVNQKHEGIRVFKSVIFNDETAIQYHQIFANNNLVITSNINMAKRRLAELNQADEVDFTKHRKMVQDTRSELDGLVLKYKAMQNEISDKDVIENAHKEMAALTNDYLDNSDEISKLSESIEELVSKKNKNSNTIVKIESDLRALDTDKELIELWNKKTALEVMAEPMDKKDPSCVSKTCSFIVNAIEAKNALPDVSTKIKERQDKLSIDRETFNETLKTARSLASDFIDKETTLLASKKILTDKRDAINKRMDTIKPNVSRYQKMKEAELKINDIKSNIRRLVNSLVTMGMVGDKKRASHKKEVTLIYNEIRSLAGKLDTRSETSIEECKASIKARSQQIEEDQKYVISSTEEIRLMKETLAYGVELKKEIEAEKDKESKLALSASRFKYIQDRCSKDGLRALEIESVVPTIIKYSNDLTFRTFGPANSLKIVTQDPDTGKEIFDMVIIDKDGEDVLLSNRSGGEQIWPLKALQLAMARINKEKSGRNFLTLLSDEEDGPLSSENAVNFTKLYRSVISPDPITGIKSFEDCIFISHRKECIDMADHLVHFGDNGISVE